MSLPTQLAFLIGAHNPPVFSGCHSQDLSTGASNPRLSWLVKLYENLTYARMRPMAIALNDSVKDIRNDVHQIMIYIWKIAIDQTSVGLTLAHPNYQSRTHKLKKLDFIHEIAFHYLRIEKHGYHIYWFCNFVTKRVRYKVQGWSGSSTRYSCQMKHCDTVEVCIITSYSSSAHLLFSSMPLISPELSRSLITNRTDWGCIYAHLKWSKLPWILGKNM